MAADLFSLIEPAIARFPERTALVTPDGQAVSYAKLAATVDAFAVAAAGAGLRPGDRVTVEIENFAVQVCLLLALTRLGVVPVIGSPTAAVLAMGLELDAAITIDMRMSPEPRNILFSQAWFEPPGSGPPRSRPADGQGPSVIASSSGTTGERKLMGFTAGLLAARTERFDHFYGTGLPNKLITLGATTIYGFTLILRALRHGGMVLQPARSARRTLELVNTWAVDEISTIPGVLVDLVRAQMADRLALPSLRQVTLGGSPLALATMREAQAWLCPRIVMSYGATETGPIAATTVDRLADLPAGAVGLIGPGAEVAAVDVGGAALPAGATGRLRITVAPELMIEGYLHADAGSLAALDGGSFYPGDIGCVTADGALVVAGRSTELVNVGGNKLSPERIEAELAEVDGVLQAGVVAIRNEQGFDDLCVALVCRPGLDPEALRGAVVRRLGSATPMRLLVVDDLPANPGGKIDRARLRRLFEEPPPTPSPGRGPLP